MTTITKLLTLLENEKGFRNVTDVEQRKRKTDLGHYILVVRPSAPFFHKQSQEF